MKKTMMMARLEQARKYVLAHPYESKSQCVLATGLSESTIARARRDLIKEGLLAESRKVDPRAGVKLAPPKPKPDPDAVSETGGQPENADKPPPAETKRGSTKPAGMLDHEAMLALAAMIDKQVELGDDEAIQKALLKQCLTFAFRTDLHPDTRMSASQMWSKLRDMSKAKDLGPGKPKTRLVAIERLRDMMVACGPEITLAAVHLAFEVKEAPDEGTVPADASTAPSSPAGTVEAPGSEADVRPVEDGGQG